MSSDRTPACPTCGSDDVAVRLAGCRGQQWELDVDPWHFNLPGYPGYREAPRTDRTPADTPEPWTIYKYPITITDEFTVLMPRAHKVIHIGEQRTFPHMWAEVDSEAESEDMTFYVVGTGNPIPPLSLHLGTWQDGRLVWHLYEPMNQRLEIRD